MSYDLKSEKEVEEYLKNLYTEYKFGCYSEKNPQVCHLLGDYEESIKTDFKKAAELYKSNCDNFHFAKSCAKFGGYVFYGKGCKKNTEEAYNYFKKACENGDGTGCTNFGILSTAEDYNKDREDKAQRFSDGIEALKKSCYEYKQDKACFHLGGLFINGVKGYLEKNFQEAYKAMLLSCENANPYACANLSQMHSRGEGVEKNEKLANEFKDRALDLYNQMTTDKSINFQQGIS